MSSLIIRLHLIIIQVKCRQTTVEFSIRFNHDGEQGLTASRLDAHQIFPNVLITAVKEFNVIITNMLGWTPTFLLSDDCSVAALISPLSHLGKNKQRGGWNLIAVRTDPEERITQDVIRMKTSVTWRGWARKLSFYSEVTAPEHLHLQLHLHLLIRQINQPVILLFFNWK